ncbi:concanavalin A-like lectin/glucanase domain-containing protein [Phycomyces nitens]|nr:concanavalin A-like lectin/glucanase domain-containing protein [Phycomyces nitens]
MIISRIVQSLVLCTLLIVVLGETSNSTDAVVCDCGFQDENALVWGNVWYADFGKYKVPIQDDNNYVVMDYTVPPQDNESFTRKFDPKNVELVDGVVKLTVTTEGGSTTSGSFATKREDFLYGSFRASLKTTDIPGTVAAFFFYRNDTCEIDIESLSHIQNPWSTFFAVQPQIYEEDGTASNLTHNKDSLDFNPTTAFHEYRFDWTPKSVIFYIDGTEQYTMTTNVPDSPGQAIINHWSDGNPNFSEGPPTTDAILEVANMTIFFNTSDSKDVPSCKNTKTACSVREEYYVDK